ncbi:MFS transporter [Leeia aquatica]|uniref:MFS transporter n=1 Tax=Leeia aquatica TaxID=2725557 RepID=A0A847SFB9_9NEIS|nr:MFS transporter [Leeia aquatica]NLR74652.1 MFS transporter [Leeia aquatica]
MASRGASSFFGSLFLARLADQVLLILVPLVVYQQTRNVGWSGLAFMLETLPRYLMFPLFGILCDRVSPVKLLRISQRSRAIISLVGIACFMTWGGLGWLIGLSAVCGVLTGQGFVAREVVLPQAFPEQPYQQVASSAQLADQLGMVLGPLLAAGLLKWWNWQGGFMVASAIFLLADLSAGRWLRYSQRSGWQPNEREPWGQALLRAFALVWRLPGLPRLVAQAAAINLLLGGVLATSAALVTGFYLRSEASYATLQAWAAAVTVVTLLLIARVSVPQRLLGILSYFSIMAGGLLAALSPTYLGYWLGYLLITGFDKSYSIYMRSERQQVIPAGDFGKVTGAMILFNNLSQPLAGALVGLVHSMAQTRSLLLGMALFMGAVGVLSFWGRRQGRVNPASQRC